MSRHSTALLALLALAGAAGAAPQDVVVLADKGPVHLRLDLTVDGKAHRDAYRAALDAYVAALFAYLDADGDGRLSEAEARRMPPPFKPAAAAGTSSINVAFNYRVVDADGDGTISHAELLDYHREFGGGSVQMLAVPTRGGLDAASSALFARLDANRDGKLSATELADAPDRLARLDLDRDDLITAAELAPLAAPALPNPVGMRQPLLPPRVSPLFAVSNDDDREALARAILARYAGRRDRIKREALGMSAPSFTRLDVDKDGELDVAELMRFASGEPDAGYAVALGKRADGQVVLAGDRPTLSAGGMLLEVRADENRPAEPAGAHGRELDRFRAAARGGRLTRKDAVTAGYPPTLFDLLDRDGDGSLTEKELTAWLEGVQAKQAALLAATPAVALSDRGSGLFELLDADRDGRLGPRELRAAARLPARLGKAGGIAAEDVPTSLVLSVGLGRADFRHGGPPPYSPREAPLLTLEWTRSDMVWFERMDRNGDGDLSLREFLGPASAFRKLDTDGDGLIGRAEAARAAALFPKK